MHKWTDILYDSETERKVIQNTGTCLYKHNEVLIILSLSLHYTYPTAGQDTPVLVQNDLCHMYCSTQ